MRGLRSPRARGCVVSEGVRIKWTCPGCGKRRKWAWDSHEAELAAKAPRQGMSCADCRTDYEGTLYRDGTTKKGRPLYRWRAG